MYCAYLLQLDLASNDLIVKILENRRDADGAPVVRFINTGRRKFSLNPHAMECVAALRSASAAKYIAHLRNIPQQVHGGDEWFVLEPGKSMDLVDLLPDPRVLPKDCKFIQASYVVHGEAGGGVSAWHGVVQSFPFRLSPRDKP